MLIITIIFCQKIQKSTRSQCKIQAKNHTILSFPRKKKSKSRLLKVQKVENKLDNKAEKYKNILKKLLKTQLLSALKFEKVTDNNARFE